MLKTKETAGRRLAWKGRGQKARGWNREKDGRTLSGSVRVKHETGWIPCLNRGTSYPIRRPALRSMNKCDCSLDTLIPGIGCNLYHLLLPLEFFPLRTSFYLYLSLVFVNLPESTPYPFYLSPSLFLSPSFFPLTASPLRPLRPFCTSRPSRLFFPVVTLAADPRKILNVGPAGTVSKGD